MLLRGVGANRLGAPHQQRPRPLVSGARGVPSWIPTSGISRCHQCRATKTDGQATKVPPKSAREAIETATQLQKEQKDYKEAVRLYLLAMEMKPSEDEARAALYNMGCALAKQKQWASATECILRAINDYNLKLAVALRDDDLKELRDRREWVDALMEVKGGLSRAAKIDLRSEAKAPFRFPRLILFGGIGISAAVGLVIISFRLAAALKGDPGAPDLQESLQNFGINSVAVVVLGGLVYWDLQGKNKSVQITSREEALGRLQIDLGGDRQLPLLRLRGQVRPVVISGSRGFVEDSLRAAAKYETKLRNRGVSVVPVILDEVEAARRASQLAAPSDPAAKIRALKREFQQQGAASNKGFGKDAAVQPQEPKEELPEVGLVETDKKWRLTPYQVVEWKEWLDEQKEFASLPKEARDVYVQIQMDGTVRSSGQGKPNWSKLVEDLPPLDTLRSSLMDGMGSTEV